MPVRDEPLEGEDAPMKQDITPFVDIASALQALIEVVQEHEDQLPRPKREALRRARVSRSELMAWVEEQR